MWSFVPYSKKCKELLEENWGVCIMTFPWKRLSCFFEIGIACYKKSFWDHSIAGITVIRNPSKTSAIWGYINIYTCIVTQFMSKAKKIHFFAFFNGIDSKEKRLARARGVMFDNLVYNKHTFICYCNISSNFRSQERVVQTKQ